MACMSAGEALNHVLQKTANFGNKDRRNRPDRDDFLLGSASSTVPENRSVVSILPASVARGYRLHLVKKIRTAESMQSNLVNGENRRESLCVHSLAMEAGSGHGGFSLFVLQHSAGFDYTSGMTKSAGGIVMRWSPWACANCGYLVS